VRANLKLITLGRKRLGRTTQKQQFRKKISGRTIQEEKSRTDNTRKHITRNYY
jgi:hypothetical protein